MNQPTPFNDYEQPPMTIGGTFDLTMFCPRCGLSGWLWSNVDGCHHDPEAVLSGRQEQAT